MILIVLSLIVFIAVFVFIHELGHFLAAKNFGLLVEEFGLGFPPRLWSKRSKETLYSVNAIPLGGFVKIFGEDLEIGSGESTSGVSENIASERSFTFLAPYKKTIILLSGVLMNFIFAWLIASVIFMFGIPGGIVVTEVAAHSPAQAAGLLPGDQIVGFTGPDKNVKTNLTLDGFSKLVEQSAGQAITLKIQRAGEIREIKAVPRINPPQGEGALGVALGDSSVPRYGFLASLWMGLKTSVEIIGVIFQSIFNLIIQVFRPGAGGVRVVINNLSGPVGIFKIGQAAGASGFLNLLQFFWIVSLNLVAVNILPIPPLDGGHILFVVIEKFKKSPISPKLKIRINQWGMALLMALLVIISVKDIIGHF